VGFPEFGGQIQDRREILLGIGGSNGNNGWEHLILADIQLRRSILILIGESQIEINASNNLGQALFLEPGLNFKQPLQKPCTKPYFC
jgi:hypothetical protein